MAKQNPLPVTSKAILLLGSIMPGQDPAADFWAELSARAREAYPFLEVLSPGAFPRAMMLDASRSFGHLNGFDRGRSWQLSLFSQDANVGTMLARAFAGWAPHGAGDWIYTLVLYTSFKGVVSGEEPERVLPAFYFGPTAYTQRHGGVAERTRLVLERILHEKLRDSPVPGVSRPITIRSTYPKMEALLRSPTWLNRYARWEVLAASKGFGVAPLLEACVPQMSLVVGLLPETTVAQVLGIFDEARTWAEEVEAAFDAPPMTEAPIPYVDSDPPNHNWQPLWKCPHCHQVAKMQGMALDGDPTFCDYACTSCHEMIFKRPAPA